MSDLKAFVCDVCSLSFSFEHMLTRHRKSHENAQKRTCAACGEVSSTMKFHQAHLLTCQTFDNKRKIKHCSSHSNAKAKKGVLLYSKNSRDAANDDVGHQIDVADSDQILIYNKGNSRETKENFKEVVHCMFCSAELAGEYLLKSHLLRCVALEREKKLLYQNDAERRHGNANIGDLPSPNSDKSSNIDDGIFEGSCVVQASLESVDDVSTSHRCSNCQAEFEHSKFLFQHALHCFYGKSEVKILASVPDECEDSAGEAGAGENVIVITAEGPSPPEIVTLEGGNYSCSLCTDASFSLSKLCADHIDLHRVPRYQCDLCQELFLSKESVANHLSFVHQMQSCRCSLCGKPYRDLVALKTHLAHHNTEKNKLFSCKLCEEKFISQADREEHSLKLHGKTTKFFCHLCNFETFNFSAKKKHISNVHVHAETRQQRLLNSLTEKHASGPPPGIFRCATCGYQSPYRHMILKHYSQSHKSLPLKDIAKFVQVSKYKLMDEIPCVECGQTFLGVIQLDSHMEGHHGVKPQYLRCKTCSRPFVSQKFLNSHMKCHTVEACKCRQCGRVLTSEAMLKKHMQWHNVSFASCDICGKQFRKGWDLKRHRHTHTRDGGGSERVSCHCCGKRVARDSLRRHLMRHEPEDSAARQPKFPCEICGKLFRERGHRTRHLLMHSDARPCVCELCGKGFKDPNSLKKHQVLHGGEEQKRFACKICPKKFHYAKNLNIHMRAHAQVISYFCMICKRGFVEQSNMELHIRQTHSKDRPYTCEYCPQRFKSSMLLKRHSMIHQGEFPYVCFAPRACGNSKFETAEQLHAHIQSHHKQSAACKECGRQFLSAARLKTHATQHEKQYVPKPGSQILDDETYATILGQSSSLDGIAINIKDEPSKIGAEETWETSAVPELDFAGNYVIVKESSEVGDAVQTEENKITVHGEEPGMQMAIITHGMDDQVVTSVDHEVAYDEQTGIEMIEDGRMFVQAADGTLQYEGIELAVGSSTQTVGYVIYEEDKKIS